MGGLGPGRRIYLGRQDLTCVKCGQTDLIIFHEQDPGIPKHRRATIDHIIPLIKGGSRFRKDNWQIMCEKCNQGKGSK